MVISHCFGILFHISHKVKDGMNDNNSSLPTLTCGKVSLPIIIPYPGPKRKFLSIITWDFKIIAIWNTAARLYLAIITVPGSGILPVIVEAKWIVKNVGNNFILIARRAEKPGREKDKLHRQ
eukprot:1143797-Pelagomonas_calceolata.AAC.4